MKATPEQWNEAGSFASDTRACLLELRARVEALEREAAMNELRAASAEARPAPASSLVEGVEQALEDHHVIGAIEGSWEAQARAAIREVTAWMRSELVSRSMAERLEQEAGR